MTLRERLTESINAAFAGLWIETAEPDEAERELKELAREQQWSIAVWDIARGLRMGDAATEATDPLSVLKALPSLARPNGTAILVLHNFHRFLQSAEIVQTLLTELQAGKARRTFVVVLAPSGRAAGRTQQRHSVLGWQRTQRRAARRAALEIGVDVDFTPPFGASDEDAWLAEYQQCVTAEWMPAECRLHPAPSAPHPHELLDPRDLATDPFEQLLWDEFALAEAEERH